MAATVLKSLFLRAGLDPAGPLFNLLEARLSSSDARFVDIIHTDFGFYGISRNTGTVDFFPNGGHRVQPGCPENFTFFSKEGTSKARHFKGSGNLRKRATTPHRPSFSEFCSHHRSWRYYAESVTNGAIFVGVQCPSLSRFSSGNCNDNVPVVMGYDTPSSASVYKKRH